MLQAGGNAVDAGVTGGICLAVVHPDIVGFAGVAPTWFSMRATGDAVSGVGPGRAGRPSSSSRMRGRDPRGAAADGRPGGPDAWITLLERHGTIGFAEAVAPAIRLARDGFPMGRFVAQTLAQYEDAYRRWPTSAAIFLPGRRPRVGERFVQADWARHSPSWRTRTAARRAAGCRRAGRGPRRLLPGRRGRRIVGYHRQRVGSSRARTWRRFGWRSSARAGPFRGHDVLTGGFWGQGPVLLQMLNLLAPVDLGRLGHNSAEYVHWWWRP